MTRSDRRSPQDNCIIWLDNLRISAIFAVVFLHVATPVWTLNYTGTTYWWIGDIWDNLTRWCIPVIVMISGALLLDPNKNESFIIFYRKRMSRIMIPLLFWSAFFLTASAIKSIMSGDHSYMQKLATRIVSGSPYPHLWFLYMIPGLYLFTPAFRKIVASTTEGEQIFLVAATFTIVIIDQVHATFYDAGNTPFTSWFLAYIPYYFLGYIIRQSSYRPPRALIFTLLATSYVVTCWGYYYGCIFFGVSEASYFHYGFSPNVIIMSVCLMYLFKSATIIVINADFVKKLSNLTLGVYLVHPLIFETLNYKWIVLNALHPAIYIPLMGIIVSLYALLIAWIISKIPYVKNII